MKKFPPKSSVPARTAEQNKYVRIPEICIKTRHFKIENPRNK